MQNYHELMQRILDEGVERPDRTGTGTLSIFGQQMRFDLNEGFPAITTKKLAWKAMLSELLWFIEGSGDERRLREILHGSRDTEKKTIWTDNAEAGYWKHKAQYEGDLGRVYGVQWRQWTNSKQEVVDQLAVLIDGLKNDPYGRRHILTAWNPGELDQMALPPCHMFSQFYVSPMNRNELSNTYFAYRDGLADKERWALDDLYEGKEKTDTVLQALGLPTQKLSCQMYQRSCDMFLGVPFNIASYSLFTHMLAQVCNLGVGEFVWTGGDCHVYLNHVNQVEEQLMRHEFPLPTLKMNKNVKTIDGFTMADFELENYQSHGPIKAKMAV